MDDYHKMRAILATLCLAGFNAKNGSTGNSLADTVAALRQADGILEECGFVHPDSVVQT